MFEFLKGSSNSRKARASKSRTARGGTLLRVESLENRIVLSRGSGFTSFPGRGRGA